MNLIYNDHFTGSEGKINVVNVYLEEIERLQAAAQAIILITLLPILIPSSFA